MAALDSGVVAAVVPEPKMPSKIKRKRTKGKGIVIPCLLSALFLLVNGSGMLNFCFAAGSFPRSKK